MSLEKFAIKLEKYLEKRNADLIKLDVSFDVYCGKIKIRRILANYMYKNIELNSLFVDNDFYISNKEYSKILFEEIKNNIYKIERLEK